MGWRKNSRMEERKGGMRGGMRNSRRTKGRQEGWGMRKSRRMKGRQEEGGMRKSRRNRERMMSRLVDGDGVKGGWEQVNERGGEDLWKIGGEMGQEGYRK